MAKKTNNQGFVYDTFDLLQFTWEKRKILIILTALAIIVSAIIAETIKPRFRSTVVLFPVASVSISKNLVETSVATSDTKDILTLGADEEGEQLLQILQSDQVRNHLQQKFNLLKHYRIDTLKEKYPLTKLANIMKGNIKIRRTEYTSIEISVLDEVPQMAADIANEISIYVDSVYYNIKIGRAREAYSIVKSENEALKKSLKVMSDSLRVIRMMGVQDYKLQIVALTKVYAKALSENNKPALNAIEDKMNVLAKYGGAYIELTSKMDYETERYSLLQSKVSAAKVNLENKMSNVFIVDKAKKSEKKALPNRMLIVLMSAISTFALSLLILLIADNIKARS